MNLFRITHPMVLNVGDYVYADSAGILHRLTNAMLEQALASKGHLPHAPEQPHTPTPRNRAKGGARAAVQARRERVAHLLKQMGGACTVDEMVELLGMDHTARAAVYHDLHKLVHDGQAYSHVEPRAGQATAVFYTDPNYMGSVAA